MKSSDSLLNWKRDVQVAVPSPESETRMEVRYLDWRRINYRISRCKNSTSGLAIAYSILFGVAGSNVPTAIGAYFASGLPAWVFPSYLALVAAALVAGSGLLFAERRLVREATEDINEVMKEMNDIEKCFPACTDRSRTAIPIDPGHLRGG